MAGAALLLLSLTIFITWQVRGQWVLAKQQIAISNLVTAPIADFDAMVEQFRLDQAKVRRRLHRQMPWVFGLTTAIGASGQLLLAVIWISHFV